MPAGLLDVPGHGTERRARPGGGLVAGVGGLVRIQARSRLKEVEGESLGFLAPTAEGHHRLDVPGTGMLQERGLQQREPPATPRLVGQADKVVVVLDLQDVDLEPGEDAPLDRLREPELGQPRPDVTESWPINASSSSSPSFPRCGLGEARIRGVAVRYSRKSAGIMAAVGRWSPAGRAGLDPR